MKLVKNEGSCTSEARSDTKTKSRRGMISDLSPLAAVLTVVLVISLSLLSLLCLRCRKKSTIIHEEAQIYDPQTFQRGGSKFAVKSSKTVTNANQMSSPSAKTSGYLAFQEDQTEEQDYQNVSVKTLSSSLEHDYIDPIACPLYGNGNNKLPAVDLNPGIYGNVFESMKVTESMEGTEDNDYENISVHQDEPDYVNENGE
ncbi:hypothetical protein CHARACLAT_006621 [Characodon lateralis]|uniref:Linker for activation of T-cells family member 2 n=1 Tax=Characodon lateralis TaxID=208331 RepID=A0ABU7CLE8_9TELE|nr:hypothetical protein [Characodon lateralis]